MLDFLATIQPSLISITFITTVLYAFLCGKLYSHIVWYGICPVLGLVLTAYHEICLFKTALPKGCSNDISIKTKHSGGLSARLKGTVRVISPPSFFVICQSSQLYLFLESHSIK